MKRVLYIAIAALIAFPVHAETVVIKAKKVYTVSGEVLAPANVVVTDGRITAVGADATAENAKTIEVDTLIPGLVDAYSQAGLSQSAERTREVTPDLKASGVINFRDRDFAEAISTGTTTLNVAPGTDNVFSGVSCAMKSAGAASGRLLSDSTGLVISACEDPRSGNGSRSRPESIYIRQPTNRMGVVWILRSTMHAASRGDAGAGMDVIRSAIKGDRNLFAVSRTHYDNLALLEIAREFAFKPVIFGGQESWKIVDDLKEAETSVVLGRLRPGVNSGREGTRLCADTAARLHKAGVPFALSQGDLLEQARFAVRNGLPADAALNAITASPAKILGIDNRVGSIAPGRDADLVALSGDPMEFTTAVRWVMVDGAVQYKQAGN